MMLDAKWILVTLFSTLSVNGFAQWNLLNPHPTANGLSAICFTSDSVGYAVGDNLTVVKTTDAGFTWNVVHAKTGSSQNLFSLHFLNDSVGFASGFEFAGKTVDGGITWNPFSLPSGSYTSVCFIDETIGFLARSNRDILKTTDGGLNWNVQSPAYGGVSGLTFLNENLGYFVNSFSNFSDEFGKIYKTVNGGTDWEETASFSNTLRTIDFFNESRAVALGGKGLVVSTTDGGVNWVESYLGPSIAFYSSTYLDSLNIVAVGIEPYWSGPTPQEMVVYKSSDGGNNWTEIPTNDLGNLTSIWALDNQSIVGVGGNGNIWRTDNSGFSWTELSEHKIPVGPLYTVDFVDSLQGIVAGSNIMALTEDGGHNWTILNNRPVTTFRHLTFLNTDEILAATDHGIYKSIDGGLSWHFKHHSAWGFIFCMDNGRAFATPITNAMTGSVTTSFDFGNTWSGGYNFDERVTEVQFLNENVGYVLGMHSVYKTVDGGSTWTKKPLGTNSLMYSFFFTDENTGYVVGDHGGAVFKTSDGGDTWTINDLPTGLSTCIRFANQDTGLIASSGNIFRTENAGQNWIREEPKVSPSWNSVCFLENEEAYAVGGGSVIITTDSSISGIGVTVSIQHEILLDNEPSQLKIYPNPSSGNVTVKFELPLANITLNVIDSSGRTVHSQSSSQVDELNLKLPGPPGIYIIQILRDQLELISTKVIKQ